MTLLYKYCSCTNMCHCVQKETRGVKHDYKKHATLHVLMPSAFEIRSSLAKRDA